MNTDRFNSNPFDGARQSPLALYLPYEFTSVSIDAGNVNPFRIDPQQTSSDRHLPFSCEYLIPLGRLELDSDSNGKLGQAPTS